MPEIQSSITNVPVRKGRPAELLKDGRKKSDALKEAAKEVGTTAKAVKVATKAEAAAKTNIDRATKAFDKLVAKGADKADIKTAKEAVKAATATHKEASKGVVAAQKVHDKTQAAQAKIVAAPTKTGYAS